VIHRIAMAGLSAEQVERAPVKTQLAADGNTADECDVEGEEEDAGLDDQPAHRPRRMPSAPNKQMSPFDVRFSQMRARHEFRDGSPVEEAVPLIEAVRCEERSQDGKTVWRLQAPFPPIEVLKWRCKLRDEQTGRPRVDPKTGGELYDSNDQMFTLDNRRLYCYQRAAVKVWPDDVLIDVVELPPGQLTRMRELKKFRTLDRGRSIFIGGRNEGEELKKWSWREAVGFASPDDSEPDIANCHVQMRRRPRGGGRSQAVDGRWQGGNGACRKSSGLEGNDASFWALSWNSFLSFIAIYALLRVGAKVVPIASSAWSLVLNSLTDFGAVVTGFFA